MGRFVLNVGETENQQNLQQNIDMLAGRIKTTASVLRDTNKGVIKSVSFDSHSLTDEELRRMWEAIKSVNPQRRDVLIPDDSPLRRLRDDFSREQALIFDGIRYAAEMVDIAYWRLFDLLQEMSSLPESELTTRQIGTAMLDVWSIVDCVNRLRDLLDAKTIGVPKDTWWHLFKHRTVDINNLRNDIQHQIESRRLQSLVVNARQIWGFLSWAEIRNEKYTGDWHIMSPGAVYRNDKWVYAGPALPSAPLPFGRIRLQAYGRDLYLGNIIKAVHDVVAELTEALQKGSVRAIGSPAVGRNGGDIIYASRLEALLDNGRKVVVIPDVGL
jgi:molybdopterin converting factor small subunit